MVSMRDSRLVWLTPYTLSATCTSCEGGGGAGRVQAQRCDGLQQLGEGRKREQLWAS